MIILNENKISIKEVDSMNHILLLLEKENFDFKNKTYSVNITLLKKEYCEEDLIDIIDSLNSLQKEFDLIRDEKNELKKKLDDKNEKIIKLEKENNELKEGLKDIESKYKVCSSIPSYTNLPFKNIYLAFENKNNHRNILDEHLTSIYNKESYNGDINLTCIGNDYCSILLILHFINGEKKKNGSIYSYIDLIVVNHKTFNYSYHIENYSYYTLIPNIHSNYLKYNNIVLVNKDNNNYDVIHR
eukprot:jgi/Orpsp1_1/1185318/evm.model.c7180000093241.1